MPRCETETQLPGKGHYSSDTDYFRGDRVYSYAHQIKTVLDLPGTRILEIGKGPGIVAAALRAGGIEVTTLDLRADLEPDLLGSVTQIPAPDRSFDSALCCQVLEHLPFSQFGLALREIHRVTREALILSLPDVTPYFFIKFRLWKGVELNYEFSRPQFRRRRPPSSGPGRFGHFWEIGYKGTKLEAVRRVLRDSGWYVVRSWRVPEMSWHRFFLLKKAG